jgi:ribonucleoside-diphosphate reductase alpha chain
LKTIQLQLQEHGVQSKIRLSRESGEYLCPDGRGGEKLYPCQTAYRLLISSSGLHTLSEVGFEPKRLEFEALKPQRNAEQFNVIVDVIDDGRYDDTYCFTEPKRNMGVFNGILTGNCNEIRLFSDDNHTFTCVLSSLNLSYYDDWKHTDAIEVATVFLDCVAEEFIQRAKGIKGLEKAVRFTEKSRALGLGVCGFHTLLQKRMLPFGSFEAHMLNNEIFSLIEKRADKASTVLWQDNGETKWGPAERRNTHLIAIAPTKSTALIMGGVSEGINPDYAMVYTQATSAGEVERVNPQLLKIMKERGVFKKEIIDDIAMNYKGSVQHVDWLSPEEKEVFKTAFEINQFDILRLAAARQKFIDQGQSLNLFFSADEEESYISSVFKEAFTNEDIHGIYYVYSESGVSASKGECVACS